MCHFPPSVDRYGSTWTGDEIAKNFSDTKDYMGVIVPIAISSVGNSLMALVSAKTAGIVRYRYVNRPALYLPARGGLS